MSIARSDLRVLRGERFLLRSMKRVRRVQAYVLAIVLARGFLHGPHDVFGDAGVAEAVFFLGAEAEDGSAALDAVDDHFFLYALAGPGDDVVAGDAAAVVTAFAGGAGALGLALSLALVGLIHLVADDVAADSADARTDGRAGA